MNKILIKNARYQLKYPYYITDDGRVYSEMVHRFLSKQLDKDGYEKIALISTDGKRHRYSIHRLVMENFCPVENMEFLQVNHKDGNKKNNALNNLEWVNCSQNIQHAYQTGLHSQFGEKNNQSKLSEEQVKEIIQLILSKKFTLKEIGEMYNVCGDTIGAIKNKHNWKYLTQDINFN